ncbi:uncharacterized protein LOC110944750 [Helianthus annuus]|uniref:uncharacterized protein LOC110919411 n=1 Tax=Helianthus annuus TaxID=4232 RepID=UPI000B907375|nr:uncharacterized protein LOC110919411 [Helianthus annuus]XP_022042090.1 uncharacterized protein LOC110944750 [Helianthus annuus]
MDSRKKSDVQPDRGKPPLAAKSGGSRGGIDGNPKLARRGVFKPNAGNKPINVIDELEKISVPVPVDVNVKESSPDREGFFETIQDGENFQEFLNQESEAGGSIPSIFPAAELVSGIEELSSSNLKPLSYAESVLKQEKKVNFRALACTTQHEGCDVVLPKESVRVVQQKLSNTLYGYFLGDRVAYPVVEYYVKNNWKRFGIQKTMMNANGFFFFKFSDQKGMRDALASGPWIIRSQPMFLHEWTPNVKLEKKEVKKVQVWVKIHEVPIAAYTEDGLSMIATAIGEPKLLDSYTSSMCMESWGRSSYARALIEISADKEFKEEITLAIPEMEGDSFTKETMYVEYEWSPLRCSSCCVFGHDNGSCPKMPRKKADHGKQDRMPPNQGSRKGKEIPKVDDDGYMDVPNKKTARKGGFPVNKQKPKFEYRPVITKRKDESNGQVTSSSFLSSNPFAVLNERHVERGQSSKSGIGDQEESDDEEVVEVYNETDDFLMEGTQNVKGASTPSVGVSNESHVDVGNLAKVCKSVFNRWDWTSNGSCCDKGTRIIAGWNSDMFDVFVIAQTDQIMHFQLIFKLDKKVLFCSVVYAANYYVKRREVWHQLSLHKALIGDKPWIIMGDFNSALNLEDHSMGSSSISIGMRDFQECVTEIEVFDINKSGCHFTWTQKPKNGVGVLKKIDRVMGNNSFVSEFPNSVALFHPYRLSDHCPCLVSIPTSGKPKPRSFKFANFLVFKPGFQECVKNAWDTHVDGVFQFQVVKKLRLLKSPLRSLLFKQGNLHKKVESIRRDLDSIQMDIDKNPMSADLRLKEAKVSADLQVACLDEERFLKQKSKVEWLNAGDANTKFFHASLKTRNHMTRIDAISNSQGVLFQGEDVPKVLVHHYENFLGRKENMSLQPTQDLFDKRLRSDDSNHMVRPITNEEVKMAMFSIGNDKAPGPDGYTAAFYKHAWQIIGPDVSKAIMDFFSYGKLLRELNNTLIVLIPKKPTPSSVTDYRPIACCNVLYKCISKIIADRLKNYLNQVVSINQSAFVPGRKISDNILLTQELMHNYHRNIGPPRCAFKVDIQKAYDTVDWRFLKHVLIGFGFHSKMIDWIMICVSTPTYSICVNGETHGYFKGKRGLRQGDPLSPYLFTLVMEILTRILNRAAQLDSSFRFHNKCEKQKIINLCFADDLFLFARGDIRSAKCIVESLTRFSSMSGLLPNTQKSTAFFCNVSSHVKDAILEVLPFEEGLLPVKYLGVPLISSSLRIKDCRVLLERLDQRIMNWKNKMLSFAGRLQLILSVLSSMHIYWASAFILPARVVNEIEAKMRNFLWAQEGSFHRGKAKVSWKAICVPKYEGGLGIRRLGDANKALMVSHIWSILIKRDSLWVQWIYSYRLRNRCLWNCKDTSSCSWTWRKILQLRSLVKDHIWSSLGAGTSISAWYDSWCHLGPLSAFLSPRVISNAGFRLDAMVADIFRDNSWAWPSSWRDLFPAINQLDHIRPDQNKQDRLLWKNGDKMTDYSSATVWDTIRFREQEITWTSIVWFPQCIPRHAFLVWLIMRRKLLTQDKILKWDFSRRKNMNMMCCLLCYADVDSHDHLFFECKFSEQVWKSVRDKTDMFDVDPKWVSIIGWLMTRIRSKKASFYVARLLVGATAYTIWQERNARLFKNQTRPPEAICEVILKTVRYKLMGVKFKPCANVKSLLGKWGIEDAAVIDDGG